MTYRFLLIFFFLFVFFSCNTNDKKNENEKFYVIKHKDYSKVNTDEISMVEYYFDYNIILFDSISDIYYHKKRWVCRTGWEFNGNLPYFGFLQPKDFIIEEGDLDNVKERILTALLSDSTKTNHRIGLIYNKDTIRDRRYFELKNFFLSNDIGVSTRKTTEEENAILKSIMEGKEYKPYLIEWKNTFGMPDSLFYEYEDK